MTKSTPDTLFDAVVAGMRDATKNGGGATSTDTDIMAASIHRNVKEFFSRCIYDAALMKSDPHETLEYIIEKVAL